MQSTHLSRLAVAIAWLSASLVATASLAQTSFDGHWSVKIVSNSSACFASDAVPILVEDGNISYVGAFNAVARGKVGNDGRLDVQLAHNGDVVRAMGALTDRTGFGHWSTPTLQCEGIWTALKD